MKNILPLDRFLRLLLAIVLFEAAYFWLSGTLQLLAYGVGAVMFLTAASRICPIYKVMGVGGSDAACSLQPSLWGRVVAVMALLAVIVGGCYGSDFLTRKIFLEDFNAMNHFYKQTLFLTGKGEREKAIFNYDQWVLK